VSFEPQLRVAEAAAAAAHGADSVGLKLAARARSLSTRANRRANSLHKLDTLIAALHVFRKGLEEEFAEYDRREAERKEVNGE
jgi:hypothetical protein